MQMIRAFIAVDLPAELQARLVEVITLFKSHLSGIPIRWVHSGNIHLTLKFLGDVSAPNLEILKKMLQGDAEQYAAFEMSIGGAGAFPSSHKPHVIWVGIEAPPALYNLQNSIDTQTAKLGYPKEDRSFSPHLTLGRVARHASFTDLQKIGKVLEQTRVGFLGIAPVTEVCLYKSDLTPDGSVYTKLYSVPLIRIIE